jgi:mono/diheme cytochrome c family protein
MRVTTMVKPLLSLLTAVLLLHPLAGLADAERGRLLYENHCLSCHESNVHIRETQAARSLAAVRAAIERWQAVGNLGWGTEEVADVAAYLNATWYHYRE